MPFPDEVRQKRGRLLLHCRVCGNEEFFDVAAERNNIDKAAVVHMRLAANDLFDVDALLYGSTSNDIQKNQLL